MTKEEKVERAVAALKELKEKLTGGWEMQSGSVAERRLFDGNTEVSFDIRYWGEWVNPDYAQDEEDYDWKILTEESHERLRKIVADLEEKHGVHIQYSTEEKCWITFRVMISVNSKK